MVTTTTTRMISLDGNDACGVTTGCLLMTAVAAAATAN